MDDASIAQSPDPRTQAADLSDRQADLDRRGLLRDATIQDKADKLQTDFLFGIQFDVRVHARTIAGPVGVFLRRI